MISQDLKYGIRVLRKNPGFTAMAVLVLALGIGANTAIFSVVNAVLLRPLPFEDPERLVQVWHVPPPASFHGMPTFAVSPANYLDWRDQNDVFEHLAVYGYESFNLTGGNQPESLTAARVAPDFFSVLRARPMLGRLFLPEEDQPGSGKVVVLSHALWKSHFGSNPNIVGQSITLDRQSYTVIGVMPAAFRLPAPPLLQWQPQLWAPMGWSDKDRAIRGNHNYLVIGRLKTGVAVKQAQAQMNAISVRLEQAYPEDDKGWGAVVVPLHEEMVGRVRPALLVLLGAVAFVLLIACANVGNLMLAKTLGRRKELAIRTALGATHGHVLRQVLSESLLLALAGAGVGLLIAHSGVTLIVAFLGNNLPRAAEINLDWRVLAFTLTISLLTGILAGLAPAWRLTRADPNEALKEGLGRTDSDSSGARTRGVLVVSEVALSLVLLIGAGLMIRSLWRLRAVDSGIDPHNVLTMVLDVSQVKYSEPAQRLGLMDRVLEGVRSLPGVEAAAGIDSLPLTGGSTQPISIEGRPAVAMSEQPEVAVRTVTPGYLRVMRIPVRRGRDFSDADEAERPAVILISESMAKRFWPNEDPIGKRLVMSFLPGVSREVVGVVGDVKHEGLDVVSPVATLYVPVAQVPWRYLSLVVRTNSQPTGVISAVTSAVHQADSEQPVADVMTMEDLMADSLAQRRFNMLLLAAFAGLALLLAAIGTYSVLSYTVRRRVQEIGIRMALGAQDSDVLRMVLGQGARLVLAGVGIGTVVALALTRLMASQLFGVTATDPLTFAGVGLLLVVVALVACYLPARRALQVDPMVALRYE